GDLRKPSLHLKLGLDNSIGLSNYLAGGSTPPQTMQKTQIPNLIFMASGPVVVLVLEGKDAIKRHRDLMGATDPAKAAAGTIRKAHGTNIEYNAVHGSDSPETARFEIGYFFPEMDLVAR
ncbi:MAG: nucleoside-diphosphate kinase, partial [Nitrospirota bacterium]